MSIATLRALPAKKLADTARGAKSLREVLRGLGIVANSKNCQALRTRLVEFSLPVPQGVAKAAWANEQRLRETFEGAQTLSEVCRRLGLRPNGGHHKAVAKHLRALGLDVDSLDGKKVAARSLTKHANGRLIPLEEVLVEGSTYPRDSLKKRLIAEGRLQYRCACCGNPGYWNGRPLVLQLEHKNGVNNDNRIENLGLLCPNCHSQTATYAGKNKKRSSELGARV